MRRAARPTRPPPGRPRDHRVGALLPLLLWACAAPDKRPGADSAAPRPPADTGPEARGPLRRVDAAAAPAILLLLNLRPDGVDVADAIPGPLWVDVDASPSPDEAFRTRVLDAAGRELFRRDTPTPALVASFLDHYSALAGVELLPLLPDLGAFHVLVPLLPEADVVVFELRDAAGVYAEVGRWRPDTAPTTAPAPPEAVAGWATIVENGPSELMLDVTLVGDGYTEAEQAQWAADAEALAARLQTAPPLDGFAGRLNIHRIDAVSAETGASYDCVDGCRFRDTAFRSVFAVNFINELSGTGYRSTTLFQLGQHTLDRALAVVPTDLAIVVVNSRAAGGTSIHHAAVSTSSDTWVETGVHEFGHLLGLLGDEYLAEGECIRSAPLGLPRNITDAPESPPWSIWIDPSTPLPTPEGAGHGHDVGAFAGAYNCPDLYRPVERCRMKSSASAEFCPVCAEQLVLQLSRYADLALPTLDETEAGARLSFDTLGLARSLRRSTDGETWVEADDPLLITEDELWVEVRLRSPLVRADDPRMVERLHFRRE